ncbi:protein kinase domain-containing protein [Mastigocoleus testarum]|uniref:protein kinase domain-containing protein n=1 Tax=Mastigocoleus testarum TaxID=996925 RepID=UPI0003FEE724|nr:protein kinase [Mastigocoleus testarum]
MINTLLDHRYQIIRVLATGGFGKTYIAEDTKRPGRPICVVKHLKPTSEDPKIFETAKRLFQSEAETLEQLGNHDQIPRLLAYFDHNQEFFLVQEFIEGHTLSDELVTNQKWSESEVVELLEEVLSILEFVHDQGVIHRDIKPDNIIRRASDNKLVLVDFGAVKQLRGSHPHGIGIPQHTATVAIGTPGYMPTEQGQGKPRPNSDLYALGIIAIQALTGVAPIDLQEDLDTGEILWQNLVAVDDQLAAFLNNMISYHFKDRYQNATQALKVLHSFTPEISNRGYARHSRNLGVGSMRVNTQQKTIAFAPANPDIPAEKPIEVRRRSNRRDSGGFDFLQVLFLAMLTGGAAVVTPLAVEAFQGLTNNFSFASNTLPGYCVAVVAGDSNIRTEPSSVNPRTIVKTLSKDTKLEAIGKRTTRGWVQLKLNSGKLVWAHSDAIKNNDEWKSCLRDKHITITTVDDRSLVADIPVPQTQRKSSQETPTTSDEVTESPKASFWDLFKNKKQEKTDSATQEGNRGDKAVKEAREKYENGDIKGAVSILRSLESKKNQVKETTDMISQWQKDWAKAESLFEDIDRAVLEGKWDKVLEYKNNPEKLPDIEYWRKKIDPLFQQANKNSVDDKTNGSETTETARAKESKADKESSDTGKLTENKNIKPKPEKSLADNILQWFEGN